MTLSEHATAASPTSDTPQVRLCRYQDCPRPAAAGGGTGRRPAYCGDPAHNPASAFQARTAAAKGAPAVDGASVDTALHRGGVLVGQLAGVAATLAEQMLATVEELRTLSDPEVAAAQIELAAADADARVASSEARASRAEQRARHAEANQSEADAAAELALQKVEATQTELARVRQGGTAVEHTLGEVSGELASVVVEVERYKAVEVALQAELVIAHEKLLAEQVHLAQARERADETAQARALAEAERVAATARADREADRAQSADVDRARVREQLDQIRGECDQACVVAGALRSELATATTERQAARADAERERAHAEQRVADLRSAHELHVQQLSEVVAAQRTSHELTVQQLRDELAAQRAAHDQQKLDRAKAHKLELQGLRDELTSEAGREA